MEQICLVSRIQTEVTFQIKTNDFITAVLANSLTLHHRSVWRARWCPHVSLSDYGPEWLLCYRMCVCLCWSPWFRWHHLFYSHLQVRTVLDHERQGLVSIICLFWWRTQSSCLSVWTTLFYWMNTCCHRDIATCICMRKMMKKILYLF